MGHFQISEADERSIVKRLFGYVYSSSVNDSGFVNHHFDSRWEQVCRFLQYFDPQGTTFDGYQATKGDSQILQEIDASFGMTLPPIEVFLDVALSSNEFRTGAHVKYLDDCMAFDRELYSILRSLDLITTDGKASEPLLLDAIDRWCFFDPDTKELTSEASALVRRVAQKAWDQATPIDREYLRANLKSGVSVERWFAMRWHLGMWVAGDWKEEFFDLFCSNRSLSWLVPKYIQSEWDET